ncbi:DUF4382 domain-containing protein [Oscillatoria amoena NRMC-F 0135]|nr:DUF4382 domain-containing protein [Oscillatoria amoena NRMC-F 0135]
MKSLVSLLFATLLAGALIILGGCSEEAQNGKIKFYITDSPIDAANVEAVVLSITRIEVNGPDGWLVVKSFDPALELNILDYQNGNSYFLTEDEFIAGEYSELRLVLDAPTNSGAPISNPGCYIRYTDESTQALFVPSGGQTGYKVKGSFTLPPDGTVAVTLDFDLRKSIVKAGMSGIYLLKPTVRLVVNQDASLLKGNFVEFDEYPKVIVYAYTAGTFSVDEAAEPEEGDVRFGKAITSASVNGSGKFTLAFLDPGDYELILASHDDNGEFVELIGKYENVSMSSGSIVELTISQDALVDP